MNRKRTGILFLSSALITIGILAFTVGRPHYAKHFNKHHCQQTEVQQP